MNRASRAGSCTPALATLPNMPLGYFSATPVLYTSIAITLLVGYVIEHNRTHVARFLFLVDVRIESSALSMIIYLFIAFGI
jgi:hypothetical protein